MEREKLPYLKTLSGLLRPELGNIEYQGERIDNKQSHEILKLGIAHVSEGRPVFPNMTVKENLIMGYYKGKDGKTKEELLDYGYDLFPILKEREKQLARTLSGGERQMLAIGRALMADPKFTSVSSKVVTQVAISTFTSSDASPTFFITCCNIRKNHLACCFSWFAVSSKISAS